MADIGAERPTYARVIVNAGGGSMQGADGAAREAELASAFAAHGLRASISLVSGEDVANALSDAREQAGPCDTVVAGGGDGTISAAAGALAGSDIPLGVLPLGTLNHLARDLGLPLDIHQAVGVIAAGRRRRIDVAEVNERVFVNNSSIGLYADMTEERDRQRREADRGKWPAMLLAGLGVLRRFRMRRLFVSTPGWDGHYATPLLFVGNNRYEVGLPNPGGRDSLEDGQLSLYVVRGRGRLGLLTIALRAALGRLDGARDLEMHLVPDAEIRTRHGRHDVLVSIDGEVTAMHQPLRYRIRPAALTVFAPGPD